MFEILLAFLQYSDWEKAFYNVIPQRKLLPEKQTLHTDNPEVPHDSDSLCSTPGRDFTSGDSAAGNIAVKADESAVKSVETPRDDVPPALAAQDVKLVSDISTTGNTAGKLDEGASVSIERSSADVIAALSTQDTV